MRLGGRWAIAVSCGVVATLLLGSSPAPGQSLADVARKEQERRQQIKKPSKVYTNEDLKRASSVLTTGAAQPEVSRAAPDTRTEAEPAGAAVAPQPEPQKDEAYWRDRITAARDELARTELFLEALQSRVNALWAEFTARDDPAQRAIVERDRLKALAEMDRVKAEIERLRKEIADIEDAARRGGVPPGWLR